MLERLTAQENGYIDSEGVYHSTPQDFICSQLNFCGCGTPNAALRHVRDALREIRDWSAERKDWPEHVARCRAIYGSDGAEYFMYYFLDHHELTEHGGAVPGWLSEKGKQLLVDLDGLELSD